MRESQVCIALDFKNKEDVFQFLDKFENEHLFVKVGMELFYGEGISMIEEIKKRGHRIFLDLKLHDIPNTVKQAMKQLAKLDVDVVNVHASGGKQMMKAAIEGLEEGKIHEKRPKCIAVTCLTSLDEKTLKEELHIQKSLEDVVLSWAANAKEAGLDGVVCSPLESKMIHEILGYDFMTVTPGIRFETDSVDDQKRVTTPLKAREYTSTSIVMGRSITKSSDPLKSYRQAVKEFEGE